MGGKVLGGREKVKVAIVQSPPVFMDKKGCLEKASRKIEEAGKQGAELIVFPETWIPTYPYWTMSWDTDSAIFAKVKIQLQDNSLVIGGKDTETLGEAAKNANAYVVMGCNELDDRVGSRTIYNTLVYFDRKGNVMGRHRKLIPSHLERIYWGRGDARDIKVFETDIGRLGGQICWENHMVNVSAAFIALGEDIHIAVWPGTWNCGIKPGETFIYAGTNITECDLTCATRERAFSGQHFVLSANNILRMEDIPDDFPFKSKMSYAGPGQENFVGWGCGGSHIVSPSSAYIVPPTFGKDTILYATLEADYIKLVKAVFDALGHYARWDLVSLNIKEETHEPIAKSAPPPVLPSPLKMKKLAEKYAIDEEKLERLLTELCAT
ncbi:MAG: carbon-nitrogen hydrolase family protein [Candidatus Bathyarchaeota archaeon]